MEENIILNFEEIPETIRDYIINVKKALITAFPGASIPKEGTKFLWHKDKHLQLIYCLLIMDIFVLMSWNNVNVDVLPHLPHAKPSNPQKN